MPAAGGPVTKATTLAKGDGSGNRYPYFLPDQKHFLYTAPAGQAPFEVRVGSLDEPGSTGKTVAQVSSNVIYSDGHIFFLRESTLMAQPFDADRLQTAGEAVPIVERVPTFASPSRMGAFDVSAAGWLVYQSGGSRGRSRLAWVDRAGKESTQIGEATDISAIQLSPDGTQLAASLPNSAGASDLWILDLLREGLRRKFTLDPSPDLSPVWTPNGTTLIWRSNRKGKFDLFRRPSNGTGIDELLFSGAQPTTPLSVSPNGKELLFSSASADLVSLDIWALPLDSTNPQPRVVLESPLDERDAEFYPPDGKWIAYVSYESSLPQVYITPYPGPGGKYQVSTATGMYPHWRRDGKELFYVTQNGDLMAAEILILNGALQVGKVERLFDGIIVDQGYLYAPDPGGRQFLIAQETSPAASPPLTLIQNWPALLKR